MSSGYINIGPLSPGSWRTPVGNSSLLPMTGNTIGDAIVVQSSGDLYIWSGSAWVVNGGGGGGGITTLTGDVTASGTGTVAATVAFVDGVSAANVASGANAANNATNLNTASTIVERDPSGNFSAGIITASLSGNATTSTSFTGPLGGDVTGTQSATAVSKIDGNTVSGTTGTGNVVFSASPTITGALSAGSAVFSSTVSASNLSGTNTGNVTIGTSNGLSLSSQVLSLGLASTSTTGALDSTDWNTFNSKQSTLTLGNLTDAGTDGIIVTNGVGAVIGAGTSIAQSRASGTQNGYLGSSDWTTFNNKGSVSSISLADTSTTPIYTISGSPITTSGTIDLTLNSQVANQVFASPNGSSGQPSFRAIVAADLPSLSGTYVLQSEVGAANGVASLDSTGHIPLAQIPMTVLEYLGTWNASTNTPTLTNGTGSSGQFYIVNTAGTANFGAGPISFNAGDWVLYNGTIWERAVQSNIVQSVNGQTGVVTVNAINQLTGDVTTSTASGSQSEVATLATVNSNVGTFGDASDVPTITVNGKGLVTAVTTNTVIAPAGTLTGSTLNSTVTASSLLTAGYMTNLNVAGPVGIGTNFPAANLDVETVITATSGLNYGTKNRTLVQPASNSGATAISIGNTLSVPLGNTSNEYLLKASYNELDHNGTGTVTYATALGGSVYNAQSGTIQNAFGAYLGVYNNNGGTINNGYGAFVDTPYDGGSGTMGNWYGLYVNGASYATNSYAIYSNGGSNYFNGLVNAQGGITTNAFTLSTGASNGYILTSNGSGVASWSAPATSGTVTSVSIVSANGFTGTVSNPTTTPAITLTGTLTGDVTGNLNSTALTATTNSTLTTLSALSLPYAQLSGTVPTWNQNTTGTAANITATNNSTITTLSSLSLPGSQVSGNISGTASNITATTNSTLTTLSALSLPTSQLSGTISLASQVSNTLPVANGGTGQTTAPAAYNALSPMTTTGDIEYEVSTGTAARLPIGTTGQVLTVIGGVPAWANGGSPGDITETTFSLANTQSSPSNITGLAFSNAVVRAATVFYCVNVSATTSLYEAGTLQLVQKGSSWEMSQTDVGDNSQVVFTVTAAGQIQYTTPTYTGFSSASIKFRAQTL